MIYEGRARIELINDDCMEALEKMDENQFDLAIVDPPYGINAVNMTMGSNPTRSRNDGHGSGPGISVAQRLKKGKLNQGSGKLKNRSLNTMNCDWDFKVPTKEYFSLIFKVSKNQIVWGGNYFNLPVTRGIIAWDKKQPWENFSQFELAWTSFDTPAMLIERSNTGGNNQEEKIHPTQKPSALYFELIKRLQNRNLIQSSDKILDTHGGSMSIAIACWDLGFDLTCYELDKDYYKAAVKRFETHMKQGQLFDAPKVETGKQLEI